ncbi:TIGR03620 family F420-dependent LLM class oxidoreductase [Nocardioides humi]|uniref:LLM class F420-dependent oxidoreductase n=1 Tax=Nocardioides humi TaxID=449461 RepID=A0ABN2AGZ1_9ACTN|nr:TIGR03620 family F420-dependent LLM class oxidoreductase [Nocardioides humi]
MSGFAPGARSVGVWAGHFRLDPAPVADAAAELEQLGYAALWYPGGLRRVFEPAEVLLNATRSLTVATGIASIWVSTAAQAAAAWSGLEERHPGRFVLGLGVSHGPAVERYALGHYDRPLQRMRGYLDELDAAGAPPAGARVLGALGPRMLQLAEERTLGSHPYLVTPDQTGVLRWQLGPDARLLPEQGVVLETDPARARELARAALAPYLALPNYVNSWLRAGFTDADVSDDGSDRLVDALVAWGEPEQIAARVRAHHDAGADHVCVQVLGADPQVPPLAQWRRVAAALEL